MKYIFWPLIIVLVIGWVLGFFVFKILGGIIHLLLVVVAIWAITTRIIVPLSKIGTAPFNSQNAIIAVIILFFCIGLPIAYFAGEFYSKRSN